MGDPLAAVVRFALYSSLGLLFGLSAFGWHGLAGKHRSHWQRSLRALLIILALVAAVTSVAGLFVMASRMFAVPMHSLDREALGTILALPGLGLALLLRAAALTLFVGIMMFAPTRLAGPIVTAAVALATLAWFGHAGASEGWLGWLHLGSTILHLLAAGLWAGALAAFLLLGARSRALPEARALLVGALGRFHCTGSLVVGLLLVTGVGNALLILGMPLNLSSLTTPWAQLMALKLVAFAAMLGLAALNRFRFAPALATPGPQSDSHLRHSLRVEFGLALVILGLVAWIGLLSPMEG
ncbi:copper homeostasis membrane protein CopD [Sandaracinobacteroides hominis]|uniref:copper homeostasis membrane protein CopD n=1 Tax=Sandaracinobacteroides hominis TaxID=2780086 RepID=UPI000DB261EC|nr:copper homeostasis membrane protein CopD [Sandaracinobacteroides hominis]PZU44479.1 MAG: copper resistance protein CopD [Sphingomonas sp.]